MIGSSDPFWALPAKRLGSHSKISGMASPGKWFSSQQNPSSYLIGFYRKHLLATQQPPRFLYCPPCNTSLRHLQSCWMDRCNKVHWLLVLIRPLQLTVQYIVFFLAEDEEDTMKTLTHEYMLTRHKGGQALAAIHRRLWSLWIRRFPILFIQICGHYSTKDDEAYCRRKKLKVCLLSQSFNKCLSVWFASALKHTSPG